MKENKMKAIQQTDTFWDKRSERYDKYMMKHGPSFKKTIENTKSLLTSSDVVLDFACASGEMSLELATHVKEIHGIDISVKMIELANQKTHHLNVENIKFNQTDVFDQSLEDNSFSAILAFNIFHFVDEAPKVLARLNDLLVPGGLLISQTSCLGERSLFFRSIVNLAQKLGLAPPVYSFRSPELESLITRNDFEIVETKIWDAKSAVQWIVARKI